MKPVGYCSQCGFFEGETCRCGKGKILLTAERRLKISKFLSGLLRHFGEEFGLKIDKNGWVELKEIERLFKKRYNIGLLEIRAIVETDTKQRFEIKDGKIRTRYGHSNKRINPKWSEGGNIPRKLYHGTAPQNVNAILKEGLKPMKRLEVHMAPDIKTARDTGKRHHPYPVIFEIDTNCLKRNGLEIRKKGKVFTCDWVPPECLRLV